jgi:hypothetical protein
MFNWTSHASLECIGVGGLGHSFEADTAYRHAAEDLMYAPVFLVPAYDRPVLYADV